MRTWPESALVVMVPGGGDRGDPSHARRGPSHRDHAARVRPIPLTDAPELAELVDPAGLAAIGLVGLLARLYAGGRLVIDMCVSGSGVRIERVDPGHTERLVGMSDGASEVRKGGRHRVVVIGSGFGGLFATRGLSAAPVDLTLVGSTGHHLFQPLLYQVATGVLSEGEIAPATREVLRRQKNVTVLLGEVTDIDVAGRTVVSRTPLGETVTPYDSLVVAAGAGQSYFGNDHFAEFAPGMKSIDDALELRGRIFGAFEMAELIEDPAGLEQWLTFVVVGAGPTGVEMAGQIAELAHSTLRRDFRRIDPTKARVILLDAAPAVLGQFGDRLSQKAKTQLEKIGVEVQLNMKVVGLDQTGVEVIGPDGDRHRIATRTKVWAAGVAASPLAAALAKQTGAELDRAGRVLVEPDTTLPGHPEIFVIGDMMSLDNLPGVAQVAMQQGRYAARTIEHRLAGKPVPPPFRYRDKGSMATVSRFHAVASVGSRIRLAGFLAWLMWLAVHLIYLIGFKNRVTTLLHWSVTFLGRGRSERVATEQQVFARLAISRNKRPAQENE